MARCHQIAKIQIMSENDGLLRARLVQNLEIRQAVQSVFVQMRGLVTMRA